MKYQFKLSKDSIKIKNSGLVDLDKSVKDDSEKTNFLLAYYADPLFPKVSRLATNKLTTNLKNKSILKAAEDIDGNTPVMEINKLTAKNFRRNFQLNHIYDYEKDYFKTSWKLRIKREDEDFFLGTSSLNVRKKLFRIPKTTLRYDREIVSMAKRYLEYYHEQNSIIETNPETGEVSFILKNENNSIMKEYNKNLTKPEGYLHVNFSKKNLFVTLTDPYGNCIKKLSGGGEGLKRRDKQKPYAVRLLVGKIAKEIVSKGFRGIDIIFNPNNTYQRWRLKPAMITLESEGILVNHIHRKIVQQHGGCRKKKSRRI